jgi:hypothetical protein
MHYAGHVKLRHLPRLPAHTEGGARFTTNGLIIGPFFERRNFTSLVPLASGLPLQLNRNSV